MPKCQFCEKEQDDFEVYGFSWSCDSCKKFNILPDEYASYIVVPKKLEEIRHYDISESKISNSEKGAWDIFTTPPLKNKIDFHVVKVTNELYELLNK